MQISITEAKGHLAKLLRRAGAGDEVGLTRHGKAAVRLVATGPAVPRDPRRVGMEAAQRSAMAKVTAGAGAACSQDVLHDDDGLPK